jgi:hypothetical protein
MWSIHISKGVIINEELSSATLLEVIDDDSPDGFIIAGEENELDDILEGF